LLYRFLHSPSAFAARHGSFGMKRPASAAAPRRNEAVESSMSLRVEESQGREIGPGDRAIGSSGHRVIASFSIFDL